MTPEELLRHMALNGTWADVDGWFTSVQWAVQEIDSLRSILKIEQEKCQAVAKECVQLTASNKNLRLTLDLHESPGKVTMTQEHYQEIVQGTRWEESHLRRDELLLPEDS